MSEKKPGITSSTPATPIIMASATERAGSSPPFMLVRSLVSVDSPCQRSASMPTTPARMTMPSVGSRPMAPPTMMNRAISMIGSAKISRNRMRPTG